MTSADLTVTCQEPRCRKTKAGRRSKQDSLIREDGTPAQTPSCLALCPSAQSQGVIMALETKLPEPLSSKVGERLAEARETAAKLRAQAQEADRVRAA